MKVERLVIGSRNPAKVAEWTDLITTQTGGLKVVGIVEIGDFPEAEESGKTFAKNARQKASHYACLTGEYVLADDGGFEVDALGGLPGVRSRRILPGDKDGTDKELIDYVLERLEGMSAEERAVRLSSAIAISDPEGNIVYEDRASIKGCAPEKAGSVLISGYPFRSILFLAELGKTYAELTLEEQKEIAHKRPVAKRVAEFLIE